ncbi:GNAT family N-acetyltransferase [Actinopolymorpha sp. B17G11]|uniref:GNAT family N-acetyltransferase n=1 Tax=Actinopolymorpha sp. B17G11 TaxID=3160861 RepID=UPI0032E3ECAE
MANLETSSAGADPVDVIIRRLLPDEWRALREIRLTALREAPSAYGATYEQTAALPDREWQRWLERDSARSAMFGARFGADRPGTDRTLVGLCGGWVDQAAESGEDSAASVDLVFMWVSPSARRRGLGVALVEEVLAWARTQGAERVHLRVTDGNVPAERLYARCGFVRTGEQVPHPSDPRLVKADMVRPLRSSS